MAIEKVIIQNFKKLKIRLKLNLSEKLIVNLIPSISSFFQNYHFLHIQAMSHF